MDNNWHQTGQSPRYMEIGSNGQVLHQAAAVPPDLMMNYIHPQQSTSYHGVSAPGQWTSYPNQSAHNKRICSMSSTEKVFLFSFFQNGGKEPAPTILIEQHIKIMVIPTIHLIRPTVLSTAQYVASNSLFS